MAEELTEKQAAILAVLSRNEALYRQGMDWATPKAIASEVEGLEVSGVVRCLQDLQRRKLVEATETTTPPREGLQVKPRRVWRITRRGRRAVLSKLRGRR